MKARRTRKNPEIVMRGGKPTAVILGIEEYRKLLEQAEDVRPQDAQSDEEKPLKFRKLDDYLKDPAGV